MTMNNADLAVIAVLREQHKDSRPQNTIWGSYTLPPSRITAQYACTVRSTCKYAVKKTLQHTSLEVEQNRRS